MGLWVGSPDPTQGRVDRPSVAAFPLPHAALAIDSVGSFVA